MSILERDAIVDFDKGKKQADVIIAATIIGFCGTRALLGQPFSLDLQDEEGDHAPDSKEAKAFLEAAQRWNLVLATIEEVLDGLHTLVKNTDHPEHLTQDDIHEAVDWGVAPTKEEVSNRDKTSTITGSTGGDALAPASRWRRPWNDPVEGKDPEYSGRGAYTGICDDPLAERMQGETILWPPRYPSKPYDLDGYNSDAEDISDASRRYRPTNIAQWQSGTKKGNVGYGVIHKSNAEPAPKGFGFDVAPRASKVVGYVHGMSQAMVESVRKGPWCVAHEHAIGDDTTKLASCFPCTTYMYAAGFPPSSTHLGRGESWVPPQEADGDQNRQYSSKLAVDTVNVLWNIQVHYYLELGCLLLEAYFQGDGARHPNNYSKAIVAQVLKVVREIKPNELDLMKNGGNLFLDALVFHDKDNERLMRVLGIKDITEARIEEIQRRLEAKQTVSMREYRSYLPQWATSPSVTVTSSGATGPNNALTITLASSSPALTVADAPMSISSVSNDDNKEREREADVVIKTDKLPIQMIFSATSPALPEGWARSAPPNPTFHGLGKYTVVDTYTKDEDRSITFTLTVEVKKPDA